MKERLDVYLTRNGFESSRERARNRILSGDVLVNGNAVSKPGTMITETDSVTLIGEGLRYVSRAGDKLEKLVDCFSLNLLGLTCVDIGASTGGFTDCMLQHGAKKVYAVDVGTNQLSGKLLNDPRVVSLEKTDIRDVKAEDLGGRADFISADVSFISLTKVLPSAVFLLKDGGRLACLIKPQFEAGRAFIGKNGIVKDKKAHKNVLRTVINCAMSLGLFIEGVTWSPIKGGSGNIEYLFSAVKREGENTDFNIAEAERIVDEAFLYYRQ